MLVYNLEEVERVWWRVAAGRPVVTGCMQLESRLPIARGLHPLSQLQQLPLECGSVPSLSCGKDIASS